MRNGGFSAEKNGENSGTWSEMTKRTPKNHPGDDHGWNKIAVFCWCTLMASLKCWGFKNMFINISPKKSPAKCLLIPMMYPYIPMMVGSCPFYTTFFGGQITGCTFGILWQFIDAFGVVKPLLYCFHFPSCSTCFDGKKSEKTFLGWLNPHLCPFMEP
jgi:hypothetical protein